MRPKTIFLICLLIWESHCFPNCNIIVEFSRSKNVTQGTVFGCFKNNEIIRLSKCLLRHFLRFFVVNIDKGSEIWERALKRKQHHFAILVDGDCGNITGFLNEHIDKTYFYETYHWLIVSETENLYDSFRSLQLNINSNFHAAIRNEGDNNYYYTIFDVYNPASEHQGELKTKRLGSYNEIDGYRAGYERNKYEERRNMTGVEFKSAVVIPKIQKPLMEYLQSDENRQIDSMHRFQSVTVNHCKEFYNFRQQRRSKNLKFLSLRIQRTDSWGYIQENGRFDGLVSLLENRIVDFGNSPLLFKLDRLPYVDYSYGNWILRSTFMFRRPKAESRSYEIFLRPLERSVWISISAILVVILILVRIIFCHELRYFRQKPLCLESSWSFLILFTLGAFCQQGATCYPTFYSSRIISISVFLFCILVYQFYSASIVSYLLMDPPRTIFSINDLLRSQLRVGVEDILIDRNYFVQTTDPDVIGLYESKIKGKTNSSGFYQPSEGLELVRKGGFAYHVETSTAYPIIEETFSNGDICELDEVQMYRTQPMYTSLQKGSPFREMMNFCMLKLVENGNMQRLRHHWDARKPTCIESAKKKEIHVGLSEFSCSPIALTFGVIVSMIFLIIEFISCFKNNIWNFFMLRFRFIKNAKIYPY